MEEEYPKTERRVTATINVGGLDDLDTDSVRTHDNLVN